MPNELTINGTLHGTLSAIGLINGAVSQFNGEYPSYTGVYEVSPDFEQQVLATENRVMHDDVTVHAIQVESVTNPSGGQTVYIGGLIDG